jgi:hypothetical protein
MCIRLSDKHNAYIFAPVSTDFLGCFRGEAGASIHIQIYLPSVHSGLAHPAQATPAPSVLKAEQEPPFITPVLIFKQNYCFFAQEVLVL